jgi:hypothetical protein
LAPARIAIIEHLIKVNSCVCGDIVNELPLAQPYPNTKELKKRGAYKGNFEGNAICYCLDEEGFNKEAFLHINTYLEKKSMLLILN